MKTLQLELPQPFSISLPSSTLAPFRSLPRGIGWADARALSPSLCLSSPFFPPTNLQATFAWALK